MTEKTIWLATLRMAARGGPKSFMVRVGAGMFICVMEWPGNQRKKGGLDAGGKAYLELPFTQTMDEHDPASRVFPKPAPFRRKGGRCMRGTSRLYI